eukprot:c7394_g1_i1 orf=358-2043(-)
MYSVCKRLGRAELLRSGAASIERSFCIALHCSYNPSNLWSYTNHCPRSYNPRCRWSYSKQEPFFFFHRLLRQATNACSDEAFSRNLADNTEANDDLALSIAHVISKQPWCPLTESELQVFLPLPCSTVNAVLNQDIAIEPALNFVSWACKQPGFVLYADDVNQIAVLWASKYATFALHDLQETINLMGSQYSEAAWAALMTTSTFLKKPEQSVSIFMEMQKHGCKPSQLSYDPFLFSLVKCQRYDVALLMIQEMLDSGISPGERALGTLLDALCSAGKSKDAYNLVQDMERLGSASHHGLAYSRLITAVWRAPKGSMALDLLHEMKLKGLKPDKQAYTVCLKLLCRSRRFNSAQSLLKDMSEHHGSLDMSTYNILINGFYRGGKAKKALELVEQIKKEGHPLDCRMYTAIVSCLFAVGRVSDAVQEFEQMQRDGHSPSVVMYLVMIKNLCESGDVKHALDLKKTMNEEGVLPNAQLYQALQRGLCLGSRYVDELLSLVEEIKIKGFSPTAEAYHTLVTHFCIQSDCDKARIWAQEMVNKGYKPTPYIMTKFPELAVVSEEG